MGRVLGALALAVIALALLLILAPFLLLAAMGVTVVAWRRPAAVSRVSQHPRIALVPTTVRSTPMRFAASLLVVTTGLTAASAAIAGSPQSHEPSASGTPVAAAEWSATAVPTELLTERPTPKATARPTTQPTPRPTRRPPPSPTPTPMPGDAPTGPTEHGVVVNVVDGDTIDAVVDGIEIRIRLIGMDTPETRSGTEWLGPEAAAATAALVLGSDVVLEKDVSEFDRYDRALRYVWITEGGGWLLVNREIIRLGMAVISTYPPDVKYIDSLFLPAQEEARTAGRGLWGVPPTPIATPRPTPIAPGPQPPGGSCHASYAGFCVTVGIGDWDCASGEGNGPNYLPVTVEVVGYDEYGLDRDNDGWGCELN